MLGLTGVRTLETIPENEPGLVGWTPPPPPGSGGLLCPWGRCPSCALRMIPGPQVSTEAVSTRLGPHRRHPKVKGMCRQAGGGPCHLVHPRPCRRFAGSGHFQGAVPGGGLSGPRADAADPHSGQHHAGAGGQAPLGAVCGERTQALGVGVSWGVGSSAQLENSSDLRGSGHRSLAALPLGSMALVPGAPSSLSMSSAAQSLPHATQPCVSQEPWEEAGAPLPFRGPFPSSRACSPCWALRTGSTVAAGSLPHLERC